MEELSEFEEARRRLQKPIKGEYLLERRIARAELRKHEDEQMHDAKVRDEYDCRYCRAVPSERTPKSLDIPIDACHQFHRGPGGNPTGDRTWRRILIALCRIHHGLWDAGQIDIIPQDPVAWFDGCADFYKKHPETGQMQHVASEKKIGVSVAVGD